MTTQHEKAAAFRALHERPGVFIIPNAWDAGSAKLLASLGFEALATTSLGLANALGRIDGTGAVSREELLANCALAAQAGVAGGSIEDATGDEAKPIYDFGLAAERVQAAAEAARALPLPFVLTARADNLMHGRRDLDDTIRRLQAFEKAGADVLYAPGLRDLATMKLVASAVSKPINVVMSAADPSLTAAQMEAVGVKRLSVGGALSRLALAAFMKGAREMKDQGGFTWVRDTMPTKDLKAVFH